MALYSLDGALPAPLPARVRLSNGLTRTNSSTFTPEELSSWGYQGPIELPQWNPTIEALEWSPDDLAYLVRFLTTEELAERALNEARQRVDYQGFYDALLVSGVYQALRSQAVESLPLTVAATEFIAAMTDAKAGRPNEPAIQACISNIMGAAQFSQEEQEELTGLMVDFAMDGLYSLNASA